MVHLHSDYLTHNPRRRQLAKTRSTICRLEEAAFPNFVVMSILPGELVSLLLAVTRYPARSSLKEGGLFAYSISRCRSTQWLPMLHLSQEAESSWVEMAHTFNPALRRQRQTDLCEFEASLVYRASSRTVRATQKNPFSKNQKKKKK